MPDSYDPEAVREALGPKIQGARCPMCGLSDWMLDETRYAMLEVTKDPDVTGPRSSFVGVSCTNCAYTAFHSAVQLGLV